LKGVTAAALCDLRIQSCLIELRADFSQVPDNKPD
jgi:hypothetical protein